MKKTLFALIATAVAIVGCGSGEKRVPFEEVNVDYILKDSTIYGFCGQGSATNAIQLFTDAGDTLMINIASALENQLVLGGYNPGDELAVVPNADSTAAIMVINTSALLGNWVMPNPIDGSSETGISLQKGGTAESIDQSSIIYKSWRLFNGQLQVQASRDDGIDMDDLIVFRIKELTDNTLVLIDSDEDIYEYTRPTMVEDEDLGIALDWGDEADYRI